MGERVLFKGNEIIGEAAVRAGCRFYYGYPITPQTEISHYLAKRMPEVGGVFMQAESEIAAINMVYGAASVGVRVMTTSSSPGISLKQEGLSYIAGAELPAVIVNIMRCGPGLGGILPAQSDYFQAVKGGGHGDYRMVVIAPGSVQELYELTVEAFNIADRYRIAVMILGDSMLGQMAESVEFKEKEDIVDFEKPWAANGTLMKREHNIITSIYVDPQVLESLNLKLQEKYKVIERDEKRVEITGCDGADVIIAAFGSVARIVRSVIDDAAVQGIKVGLIRPITLWPFPTEAFKRYAEVPKGFLTVEANSGQMIEDVRLSLNGKNDVRFHGRMGGMMPTHEDIMKEIMNIMNN